MPVSFLGILLAAIASMIVGMIWYSPLLFVKPWMRFSGIKKSGKQKGMAFSYIVMFIGTFVTAYVLAQVISFTGAFSFSEGMMIGFGVWLGFIAPTMLGIVLWESKPWALYFINAGYYLVSLLIAGLILVRWS